MVHQKHAKLDRGKSTRLQPYTKPDRQPSKTGNKRHSPPKEREQQLVVKCQRVRPENINASNVIWTQQALLRNIYGCANIVCNNK